MAAMPIVCSHSGQALSPVIQPPGSHEPSTAMASVPWGSISVATRAPTEASSATSSDGARPSP